MLGGGGAGRKQARWSYMQKKELRSMKTQTTKMQKTLTGLNKSVKQLNKKLSKFK